MTFNRLLPQLHLRAKQRGFTIVEMLVVLAIVVVIVGLTLRIMSETEQAARTISDRQAALQYCESALERITADIQDTVDPSQIPTLKGKTSVHPIFQKDQLGLVAVDQNRDGSLVMWTAQNIAGGAVAHAHIARQFEPIPALAGQHTATHAADDPGGLIPEHFTPVVRFGYAGVPQPTVPTVFQDSWTSASMPALIQVTVTATLDGSAREPIELQTAVIPGFLPRAAKGSASGTNGAPAAPVPAASPLPTPATTAAPTPATTAAPTPVKTPIPVASPAPVSTPPAARPANATPPTSATQGAKPSATPGAKP